MADKKHTIELLLVQKCCKILCLLILPLFAAACHGPKPSVLLEAQEGEVKLEVDSVLHWPELANFPIRLRLTNYSDKKVVLVFDTVSNVYEHQVRNFFITSGNDTFILGIETFGMPLVFNERTTTTFNCEGYFIVGEGHFDSIGEIESK